VSDKLQPDNLFQALAMKLWMKYQDWKYERSQAALKRKIKKQERKTK
jgi:hypothetical protein